MTGIKTQNIGFIGLGNMGMAMARNLLNARANVFAYDIAPEAVATIEREGATVVGDPAEAASKAEIVIIMVNTTAATEGVLLGERGVLSGLTPGTVVIDMGTTAIGATKRFAKTIAEAGGKYLDAPVSGGVEGARGGALAIMCGGDPEAFAQVEPVLKVMGGQITYLGDAGAGQVTKAINQLILGVTIQAVAEGITLARKSGIDPAKVREAIRGGYAGSMVLERHAVRMIEGDFSAPGYIAITHKDLAQALSHAKEVSLTLPALEMNVSLFNKCLEEGLGGLDQSALIKVIDPDV